MDNYTESGALNFNNNQTPETITIEDAYRIAILLKPKSSPDKLAKTADIYYKKYLKKQSESSHGKENVIVSPSELTVSGIKLTAGNILRCAVSGDLYFFQRKNHKRLIIIKAVDKKAAIEQFIAGNNIETDREPDGINNRNDKKGSRWLGVYKLSAYYKLKRRLNAGLFSVLSVLLTFCILLFTLSLNAKTYVSSALMEAGLSSAVSHRMMDTVIDTLYPSGTQANSEDNKFLQRIQTDIEESYIIEQIADKYIDASVKGISSGKSFDSIYVDISDEMSQLISFVNKEINERADLTDSQKDAVRISLIQDAVSAEKAINNYASDVYNDVSDRASGIIKVYKEFSSLKMIVLLGLFAYIIYAILVVITPVRVLRFSMPLTFLISGGIYLFITNVLGNSVLRFLSNRLLGRTVYINETLGYITFGVIAFIAVMIFIVLMVKYFKYKKILKRDYV
ncbi:MAG: hypothetical protein PUD10_01995 [Lachnospira sp.]|nr:hypothetical protein [Lachnospira sp.]